MLVPITDLKSNYPVDILTTWLSSSSKTHSESVWALYLGSHVWQGISSWPFVALSLLLNKKPELIV